MLQELTSDPVLAGGQRERQIKLLDDLVCVMLVPTVPFPPRLMCGVMHGRGRDGKLPPLCRTFPCLYLDMQMQMLVLGRLAQKFGHTCHAQAQACKSQLQFVLGLAQDLLAIDVFDEILPL